MALDDSEFDWTVSYVTILSIAMLTTFCTLVLSFKAHQGRRVRCASTFSTRSVAPTLSTRRVAGCFTSRCSATGRGSATSSTTSRTAASSACRVVYANETGNNLEVILIISLLGDISLLTTTFWVITMAFEMTATHRQEQWIRGRERERRIIRNYVIRTYSTGVLFASAMVFSAWLSPGQKSRVQRIAFRLPADLHLGLVSLPTLLYAQDLVPETHSCRDSSRVARASSAYQAPRDCLLRASSSRHASLSCLSQWMDDVPIVWIGLSQGL
ncbi:hypothetical protein PINS_up020587 [Pythium insidiosum]|nr:hypothetical protein PINS_up020587 [Pythium insidiosum]